MVDEPTDLVSQMGIAAKPDISLRICIDRLTLMCGIALLKRKHYKLRTLEDILPNMNQDGRFIRRDASSAFWHVRVDNVTSKLTTMIILLVDMVR